MQLKRQDMLLGLRRSVYPLFCQLLFKNIYVVVLHGHLAQPAVHLTQPVHEGHLVLSEQLRVGQSLLQHLGLPPAALLQLYVSSLGGVQLGLNKLLIVHRAHGSEHLTQADSLKQVFTVVHYLLL